MVENLIYWQLLFLKKKEKSVDPKMQQWSFLYHVKIFIKSLNLLASDHCA